MINIVYFGYPARSHTVPSLILVKTLIAGGATVQYHSTPAYQEMIQGSGAQFVPYPLPCEELVKPAYALTVQAYARAIAAVTHELRPAAAMASRSAALILSDASAYWGRAASRDGIPPSVAFATTFAFTRPMLQIMGIRDPEDLDILLPTADLQIVCTSRYFQPIGQVFDESYVFAGPLLDAHPRSGTVVKKSGSRPLAYVSLGTIFNRDGNLLRCIASVLASAGYEVIVALGGNTAVGGGPWPQHVRAIPFVDQISALKIVDLAVTHGGMASMSEILFSGVPAIVIPQAVDQFLVGKRAAALGAAVVADPKLDTGSALRIALESVRRNEYTMRASSCRVAQSFANVTPLAQIADRVLNFAVTGCRNRP